MPRTVLKEVFKFDELDESAKDKAREWFRHGVFSESHDWEFIFEDAARMGDLMGIDIRTRPVKLMNGSSRYDPCIYFSGFSSQGDGACFEGSYRYAKGGAAAVAKECGGTDAELIRIAQGLQDVQRRHFYRLSATCEHRGHYCHSGCMDVEVYDYEDIYRDIGDAEEEIRQLLRDFADWIYNQLEEEHDYQSSDEVVDEMLLINEYEFNVDGSIY